MESLFCDKRNLGPIFLLIQITLKGFPEGFLVRLMIGVTKDPSKRIINVTFLSKRTRLKCFPYFQEIPLKCFKTFTITKVLMNSVLRVETIKLGILKPPEKSVKTFGCPFSFLAVDCKKY